MKLYARLAYDAMRKNKRMYLPFLMTCTGMVAIFYIISYLSDSPIVANMRGGETLTTMMSLGSFVIGIFSLIFLFYTNSFLMRRRKKEFGLYHMLGMGKGNLALILLWQTGMIAAFALVTGLALGIALSKLAELALVRLMHDKTSYALRVSWHSVGMTLLIFSAIFLLQFLSALRSLHRSSTVSLLRSENFGEKPPRANWLLALLGLLLLAGAYYLAVSIEDPITALTWFFIAVVMVVLGTYLLMIAGSVTLCRLLQKRKSYYYKPNHFVSTASMAYRMKRNGAGLASICILATMVLVILSSTTSLYFSVEDTLVERYPREMLVELRVDRLGELERSNLEPIGEAAQQAVREQGGTPQNTLSLRYLYTTCVVDASGALHPEFDSAEDLQKVVSGRLCALLIFPLEDYNAVMHKNVRLNEGETMVYTERIELNGSELPFADGTRIPVTKRADEIPCNGMVDLDTYPVVALIVPDLSAAQPLLRDDERTLSMRYLYGIDTGLSAAKQEAANEVLNEKLGSGSTFQSDSYFYTVNGREIERGMFFSLYGGLFYLGILLCIVFVCATVLMIYYKQVCEGYEDQARFSIMQKVGMTRREIRKSINSQLLTVFFLPLLGAGLHLVFAFPMIRRLLALFQLKDVALFAWTTVISFAAFALFYSIVYRVTSAAYYSIVSDQK